MSPTTDNFIHSLVEMSKAFEELPQVRHELEVVQGANFTLHESLTAREESILKLKAELEQAYEARRKVEAERDDAELRFLELDEKAHKALAALGNIMANVNDATRDLTPPKPEPVPEPTVEPVQQVQSATDPISDHPAPIGTGTEPVASSSEGQRAPLDPTANSTVGDGHSSETAPVGTVATDAPSLEQTPTAQPEPVRLQPYAGKRYVDHPVYVMLHDWLAGGGTEADYYAR